MKAINYIKNKINGAPLNSPWGMIEDPITEIAPGVYMVASASHGGIMIRKQDAEKMFSQEAIKCGFEFNGWYCFEEDCEMFVIMRELLDDPDWDTSRCDIDISRTELEDYINTGLKKYSAEYWRFWVSRCDC